MTATQLKKAELRAAFVMKRCRTPIAMISPSPPYIKNREASMSLINIIYHLPFTLSRFATSQTPFLFTSRSLSAPGCP